MAVDEDWETKARAWLSTLPSHHNVSSDEMDGWIDSNLSSHLRSLPRPHLHRQILSILHLIRQSHHQEADGNLIETPCPRFQRTDHWKPVYSWLESLESTEVVTSEEIVDWLSKNPIEKEKLCSRYSRHHLKHYIQRCHMKMLKRREKLRKALAGVQVTESHLTTAPMIVKNEVVAADIHRPCSIMDYSIKDTDISLAKKNEASVRFELLTQLQKELTNLLSKHRQPGDLKESGSASFARERPSENASCQ